MQIQRGLYKGQKLQRAATSSIRPCTGRVKKSLFDTLLSRIDIDESRVLDLFAGFGNLGFEALSLGAREATFVDQDRRSLSSITTTADKLGLRKEARIVRHDVTRFIALAPEHSTYDIIFCDPPYSWPDYEGLIALIFHKPLLAQGGWLLIEHDARHRFTELPEYAFHKEYGNTVVTFFTPTGACS
ncbi:16S rRNA (guanine(966)-N(2))-methyltransferase RsmD [Prosthecochloris vibrioformis]|uniref:16S rRNA (Guanine(966)-N(2))-methyltransferase RsmD n=1 Tax=Prosthecochloris vibrioformis TaxID=1098 RepID=A0A5C4S2Q5_PROVB|nr:16S rRNA (guanine(966)-N(2))-methyltransferase RsmD [Prosthecochloris vibrioformis]TNJ37417.1 16S rRNA (guanine(966)-N(2))-methyltransferase RsmD [Prosthecochloris vibrioformis]